MINLRRQWLEEIKDLIKKVKGQTKWKLHPKKKIKIRKEANDMALEELCKIYWKAFIII